MVQGMAGCPSCGAPGSALFARQSAHAALALPDGLLRPPSRLDCAKVTPDPPLPPPPPPQSKLAPGGVAGLPPPGSTDGRCSGRWVAQRGERAPLPATTALLHRRRAIAV